MCIHATCCSLLNIHVPCKASAESSIRTGGVGHLCCTPGWVRFLQLSAGCSRLLAGRVHDQPGSTVRGRRNDIYWNQSHPLGSLWCLKSYRKHWWVKGRLQWVKMTGTKLEASSAQYSNHWPCPCGAQRKLRPWLGAVAKQSSALCGRQHGTEEKRFILCCLQEVRDVLEKNYSSHDKGP